MPYFKTIWWMAGLAAVVCAFLFRPSFLRAQGSVEGYPILSPPRPGERSRNGPGTPGSSCWTSGLRKSSMRSGSQGRY